MDQIEIKNIFIILLCILTAILMCGCAKTIYVPVETIKTEYKNKTERDSIHILDSVIIKEKGDTVFIREVRAVYVDKIINDTVVIQDTIPTPYPQIKYKGKELTKWQKIKLRAGEIVLFGIIGFLIIWFIKRKK